ncbi:lysophosphatidic acid receptor 4-like [Amia ocellicauda]|uniref:lysophosphatidic acid receptor 4-like n=1 Tax=Amia ocellicauda TaxID=2972642 RepID=UPI0034646D25
MDSFRANSSLGPNGNFTKKDTWDFEMNELVTICVVMSSGYVFWVILQLVSIFVGLPSNIALFWLLLSSKNAWSFTELLLLHLGMMDILFCVGLPLEAYATFKGASEKMYMTLNTLYALNMFGRPLLLCCICVERFLAVVHPNTFLKLTVRQNRILSSVFIWFCTMSMCVFAYFKTMQTILLTLVCIITALIIIMIYCNVVMALVLRKADPGTETEELSVKKDALKTVMLVLAASVVVYTPVLSLASLMEAFAMKKANNLYCIVIPVLFAFPSLGVCIGPATYLLNVGKSILERFPCFKNESTPID